LVKRAKVEDDDDESDSIDSFYSKYRGLLAIDKHGLDEEWVAQPGIVQEIGERLALEISRRDEAKDDVADVVSELDAIVREAHAEDDKKPTETAIKNEIAQDPKVKKAKKRFRLLELNVGRLTALKDSFHQRRYALQDLTSLHLGGYYTSNSGAAKAARETTHDSSRKAMQSERKRRETD
jgi:hypothetical protein